MSIYSDASFGTNTDVSSQIGFIVLFCDKNDNFHVLDYASRKAKRVARSITGGDVHAISEAFDAAFMLRHDLEDFHGSKIPLHMFNDSHQLFDVMTKVSSTSERRLMIDVAALRESYNSFEIDQLVLLRGKMNIADALTKATPNCRLDTLLSTSLDDTVVEQWVECGIFA